MGGFFGGFGFNDLVSPPQSPRSRVSSESSTPVPVYMNNQVVYVPERLRPDVCNAVDRIRSNWFNALNLKKEVLLDPDILIPLLNHSKLYWYAWLAKQPEETSASDRIENAFINNKNLSKEESEWVRETIREYKNTIESAIAQKSLNSIPPFFDTEEVGEMNRINRVQAQQNNQTNRNQQNNQTNRAITPPPRVAFRSERPDSVVSHNGNRVLSE